jgi:hypothetical protein
MARRKKLIDKQVKKKVDGRCYFCPVDEYELLDVHRIIEGADGGEYTDHNTIVACALCHRRIHSGEIKIDRKYFSTSGRWVLHYWKDGQEFWD